MKFNMIYDKCSICGVKRIYAKKTPMGCPCQWKAVKNELDNQVIPEIPRPDLTKIHLVPISKDDTPKVYQNLKDCTDDIDSEVDIVMSHDEDD